MTQVKLQNQNSSLNNQNPLQGILFLIYGLFCYCIFFVTFLYAMGFAGNFLVPKSMDTGGTPSFVKALITDTLLLAV
ncbi:MAG: isoprenylcysteine carboxylmethyltransferase family protein, partial [Cyanobacteria bacterium J06632_19]